MPKSAQSLRLTDRYSRQLATTAARVARIAKGRWNLAPEDFDGSYSTWLDAVVPVVTSAQRSNERLTTAYLTAFIASETGKRPRLKKVDSVAGLSRDGRPLREAWDSPPIKAKVVVGDGGTVEQASAEARTAALRLADLDTYYGARGPMSALLTAVAAIEGYTRVAGVNACGACLGAADGTVFSSDEVFQFHANCDCVAEPVLIGDPGTVTRPSGQEIFNDLPEAEQDRRLGEKAAEAVRGGLPLSSLVGEAHMDNEADWITQKPLAAL